MVNNFIKSNKILAQIRKVLANRVVLALLQISLISAALALAVVSLRRSGTSLQLNEINLYLVAPAIFFYFLFYVFLSIHWAYSLHIIESRKLDLRQIAAFFASQPYKYLPTSAFSISARSIYSKRVGAHRLSSTAKAQLVENGSIFVSGLVIIALAKAHLSLAILIPLIILIFISLFSVSFRPYRELKKAYRYLALVSIALVAWLVGGLSLFATISSVGGGITYEEAIYLNAATFLASIAAVLVPAGIGIREAILFSQNVALPGVLLWRIVSVVVDIISGILAIFKINKQKV